MKILARFSLFLFMMVFLGIAGCSKKESVKLTGKIFHTVARDNIRTADPTNAYDEVSLDVLHQIYEPLYQYNYFSEKIEFIPLLTKEMPKVSADGLTYTLKLREDIRFQDDPCFKSTNGKGRAVVASDFIYAWKRHANPKNETQAFWIWDGKVKGISELQKKLGESKNIAETMNEPFEGFSALDDHTIQIKLVKKYPQLIDIFSMIFVAPVAHEAIEMYGKDFVNHPVGTGPFRAVEWSPTSKISLVRNENYHDEFFPQADKISHKFAEMKKYAGKKLPLVDAIEYTVLKEEQPRWLNFLDGKFDQIKIPKDNFSAAVVKNQATNQPEVTKDLAAKGISVTYEPSMIFWYVTINTKDALLGSNKYLRQAIASSIDAKVWLEMFKNGRGEIQNEVNPPGIVDRCGQPYRWTFDLNRAKSLLEKAGYPGGKGLPVFRYDTRNTEGSERQLAEFLSTNLAKVGIKLDITMNTFPAFLDKMNKGNLQISKGGWNSDYPDAENNLQLLYGPSKSPGPNDSNFDNPEYNKLFEKMAQMQSGPERKKIICEMEKIIQEEAPWSYGIYEFEYRLVNKWLKNYRANELIINKYKYLDVEK